MESEGYTRPTNTINAQSLRGLPTGNYVFSNAGALSSNLVLYIGSTVENIPANMFSPTNAGSYYARIKSIDWGTSEVKVIGANAFRWLKDLTEITIPTSITYIGEFSFFDCLNVETVNFNATGCLDLGDYTYDSVDNKWNPGNYAFHNLGKNSYDNGTGVTVNIGAYVTNIPAHIFHSTKYNYPYAPRIIAINWGESKVTSIGEYAFHNCGYLTELTIPEDVETIGNYAFANGYALEKITISNIYYTLQNLNPENGIFSNAGANKVSKDGNGNVVGELVVYLINPTVDDGDVPDNLFFSGYSNVPRITKVIVDSSWIWVGESSFENCSYLETFDWSGERFGGVGNYAFRGCSSLKYGANGEEFSCKQIESIGYYAFADCSSLKKAEITTHEIYDEYYDTTIEENAFWNCTGLEEIAITFYNDNYKIVDGAFRWCTNVTKLTINCASNRTAAMHNFMENNYVFYGLGINGTGVEVIIDTYNIPDYFLCPLNDSMYSPNIVSLTISDKCTSIGSRAFKDISSLTELTIPANVTTIGQYAFYGMTGVKTLNYNAKKVTTIGGVDVSSPTSHTEAKRDAAVGLFSKLGNTGFDSTDLSGGVTVNIGSNVTYIPSYLFLFSGTSMSESLAPKITDIVFDGNLTGNKIGNRAFDKLFFLKSINLPSGITQINELTFYYCKNLTSITLPSSIQKIGYKAFAYCSALNTVGNIDLVTSIGKEAFSNSGLTVINISEITLGEGAFSYCTKLTTATIDLGQLPKNLLLGCTALTTLNIRGGDWYYTDSSSYTDGTAIPSTELDTMAEKITAFTTTYADKYLYNYELFRFELVENGDDDYYSVRAGADAANVTELVIPDTYNGLPVRKIASEGFSGYTYLTSLTSLTSITIPESITLIGGGAFAGCINLTTINYNAINATVQEWDKIDEYDYVDDDGSNQTNYLWSYSDAFRNAGKSSGAITVNIGANVEVIPDYLFYSNLEVFSGVENEYGYYDTVYEATYPRITTVNFLGNALKTIGNYAFANCLVLTGTLTTPSSLESIGDYAFAYSDLTTVNLNEGLLSIGEYAFTGADLTIFTIPDTVTTVGEGVVEDNHNLTRLNIGKGVKTLGDWLLRDSTNTRRNITIYFNAENLSTFEAEAQSAQGNERYHEAFITWAYGWEAEEGISNSGNTTFIIGKDVKRIPSYLLGSVYEEWEPGDSVNTYYPLNNVTSLIFEEGSNVQTIGRLAFAQCSVNIVLPSSVEHIEPYALYYEYNNGCNPTSVTFEDTTKTWFYTSNSDYTNGNVIPSSEVANMYETYRQYYLYTEDTVLIYELSEDGTYYIVSAGANIGSVTKVDILSTYNNLPVTHIDVLGFQDCTSLTSITIPDSITTIGNYAFSGCTALTSITIPSSVTKIGANAFKDSGITSITLNTGAEKGWFHTTSSDYTNGTAISPTEFATPEAVSTAFKTAYTSEYLYALDLLVFTLQTNDTYSVKAANTSIPYANIPATYNGKNVTAILDSAFRDCTLLTSITIPENVTKLGHNILVNCTSLSVINYNAINVTDFAKNHANYYYFYGCVFGSIGAKVILNIGAEVTNIPSDMFRDHDSYNESTVTSINIAENSKLTTIGEYAFYNETDLVSINLEGCTNLTTIGEYAFAECTSLTNVNLGNCANLTTIGEKAYFNTGLISVTIPENVTTLGGGAFANLHNLTEINYNAINATVNSWVIETIEVSVYDSETHDWYDYYYEDHYSDGDLFRNAGTTSGAITVNIGANVQTIPAYLFYSDNAIGVEGESVELDPDTESASASYDDIESYPRITAVNFLGNSVTTIGSYAFANNGSLTNITLPNSVTTIEGYAFAGYYTALQSVVLSSNLESIGANAFNRCTALTSINLGECANLTTIGSMAFYKCISLKTITIPENVTTISSPFGACTSLATINYNAKAATTASLGRISGDASCLTVINIGENVISLPDNIFKESSVEYASISQIVFAENSKLETIGDYAFYHQKLITSINLEVCKKLTTIGAGVFAGCSALTSITIPENVTSIGTYVFAGCSALTSITIPENVTSLGAYILSSCDSLETIYYNATNVTTLLTYDWEKPFVSTSWYGRVSAKLIIGANVKELPYRIFAPYIEENETEDSEGNIETYTEDYGPYFSSIVFSEGSQLIKISQYAFNNNDYNYGYEPTITYAEGFDSGWYYTTSSSYENGTAILSDNFKTHLLDGSYYLYRKAADFTVTIESDSSTNTLNYNNGQTITLSASVTPASSRLTYQWYRNNVAIDGATSATYAHTSTILPGEYTYKCAVGVDGIYGESNSITVTVNKGLLTKPTLDTSVTYVYDGTLKTVKLNNFDEDLMVVTGNTGTTVGGYTAVVSLNTEYYTWEDSSTEDVSIAWSILPATLTLPTVSGTYVYNGNVQNVSFSGLDETVMSASGELSATNAGTYTATISLVDTTNYTWSDGTTGAKTITWEIVKADVTISLSSSSVTVKIGEVLTDVITATLTYPGTTDNTTITVSGTTAAEFTASTISNKQSKISVKGLSQAVNTTVTVTFAGDDNLNVGTATFVLNVNGVVVSLVSNGNGTISHASGTEITVDYNASITDITATGSSNYGLYYYTISKSGSGEVISTVYNTLDSGFSITSGTFGVENITESLTVTAYFNPVITLNFVVTGGELTDTSALLSGTYNSAYSLTTKMNSVYTAKVDGTQVATATVFANSDMVYDFVGTAKDTGTTKTVISGLTLDGYKILQNPTASISGSSGVCVLSSLIDSGASFEAGNAYTVEYTFINVVPVENITSTDGKASISVSGNTVTIDDGHYIELESSVGITVNNISTGYTFVGFKTDTTMYFNNSKTGLVLDESASTETSYVYNATLSGDMATITPVIIKNYSKTIEVTMNTDATMTLTHVETGLKYNVTNGKLESSVASTMLHGEYKLSGLTGGTVTVTMISTAGTTVIEPNSDGTYSFTIDDTVTSITITVE